MSDVATQPARSLADAVAQAYRAFASYPRRDAIDACPCCVRDQERHTLARVPLRELSCAQLSRYGFKAITTWGGPDDYKHFLPRILELAITREARTWSGLELAVVAGKLRLAGFRAWPAGEATAVLRFGDALWEHVLESHPAETDWRASELLPVIASIVEDVEPLLARWEAAGSRRAVRQLAEYVESRAPALWEDATGCERVERWLRDPARRQWLEAAFEEAIDSPDADALAAAIDLLPS